MNSEDENTGNHFTPDGERLYAGDLDEGLEMVSLEQRKPKTKFGTALDIIGLIAVTLLIGILIRRQCRRARSPSTRKEETKTNNSQKKQARLDKLRVFEMLQKKVEEKKGEMLAKMKEERAKLPTQPSFGSSANLDGSPTKPKSQSSKRKQAVNCRRPSIAANNNSRLPTKHLQLTRLQAGRQSPGVLSGFPKQKQEARIYNSKNTAQQDYSAEIGIMPTCKLEYENISNLALPQSAMDSHTTSSPNKLSMAAPSVFETPVTFPRVSGPFAPPDEQRREPYLMRHPEAASAISGSTIQLYGTSYFQQVGPPLVVDEESGACLKKDPNQDEVVCPGNINISASY